MSKPTPGPWTIKYAYNVMAGGRAVANAGIHSNNCDDRRVEEENKANARLIAAAPELLEALEDIEMETRAGGQWTVAEINEVAKAAIKKARGE